MVKCKAYVASNWLSFGVASDNGGLSIKKTGSQACQSSTI